MIYHHIARDNQNTTLVDLSATVEPVHAQNITSAAVTLEKIGLIALNGKEISVTDAGMNVLKDENMVDETGQLTPDGQEYQFMFTAGEEGKTQDDVNQEMGMPPMPNDPMGGQPPMGGQEPPMDLGMPNQPMMAGATFSLRDALKFISES